MYILCKVTTITIVTIEAVKWSLIDEIVEIEHWSRLLALSKPQSSQSPPLIGLFLYLVWKLHPQCIVSVDIDIIRTTVWAMSQPGIPIICLHLSHFYHLSCSNSVWLWAVCTEYIYSVGSSCIKFSLTMLFGCGCPPTSCTARQPRSPIPLIQCDFCSG